MTEITLLPEEYKANVKAIVLRTPIPYGMAKTMVLKPEAEVPAEVIVKRKMDTETMEKYFVKADLKHYNKDLSKVTFVGFKKAEQFMGDRGEPAKVCVVSHPGVNNLDPAKGEDSNSKIQEYAFPKKTTRTLIKLRSLFAANDKSKMIRLKDMEFPEIKEF